MNKVFRNGILFACILVCMSSLSVPCFAADAGSVPSFIENRMTNISNARCAFNAKNGKASATVTVMGIPGATKCEINLEIQEKKGNSWATVDSWNTTQKGQSATISQSASVKKGTACRAVATVTVWAKGSPETKTVTSSEATA